MARYLFTRGVLLVLLELTVLRESWTFNADFAHYNLAGVLWMLGWCMVLMSGIVWLPTPVIGAVGLLIVFGQSVVRPLAATLPSAIGKVLYLGGQFSLWPGGPPVDVLYVLIPWIGVMAAGYAFGAIVIWDSDRRRKACLWIGGIATAAFVIIATAVAVGAAAGPDAPPLLFRILGQRKYPASPWFLMMTLGPTIALIPLAERLEGWFTRVMVVFGRVPLFFYVLHIPLIHSLACVVSLIREGRIDPWLFGNHPLEPPPVPPGYQWSLLLLYLVFVIAIALLYAPCRWYGQVKARSSAMWTRLL